ncbi:MAG TPA: AmmeMemoRadiSam system protein A [Terriglobales bacterium]|nr:AmmeMemoRadiSam system protein A [Terriglobales bacterium]
MSLPPEDRSYKAGRVGISQLAVPAIADPDPQYSPEERLSLIRLAREAILSSLEQRDVVLPGTAGRLQEPRGAFTTLYLEGEVRGCVGYVYPVAPLVQTIVETARAAAFQDMRFLPVTPDEATRLKIEISVLSRLVQVTAEEIVLGKHGLLLSFGTSRGLLLPQVPIEHGWDRVTFLQQVCRKAGLGSDAWQHGAILEAFTAEVFGEHE